MFNTFKYDPETRQVQQLRKAFDPITARTSQHQACTNCKAKKLRCSGEKTGCERCAAGQLVCEYPRTRSRSRSTRRAGAGAGAVKKSNSEQPGESTSSSSAAGQPPHGHSPSPMSSPSTTSPSSSQYRQDTSSSFGPQSTQQGMMLHESGLANQVLPRNERAMHSVSTGYEHNANAAMTGATAPWAEYQTTYPFSQEADWQPSQTQYLGSTATGEELFSLYPDYTEFQQEDSHQTQYWPDESRQL